VTKKSDQAQKLLEKITLQWPLPEPLEGANLMEQGLYAILQRSLEPSKARGALQTLKAAYADWNELRVAQAQEIAGHLKLGANGVRVARDVREYLQEVFQRSHGLDLEFLRDDPVASSRFVSQLPFIGMGTANYLLWLANNQQFSVTPPLVRVLDRLGLMSRSASMKKAKAAIEPLVPAEDYLTFSVRFGEVASRWCDARKPLCYACVLVDDCKYGRKAFREWKIQQERLELQRAREAARQAVLQRKDEERRAREAERQRKRDAIEAAKRAREAERLARIEAKRRAAEEHRLAKERAKAEAVRKKAEAIAAKKAAVEEKKRLAKEAAAKALAAKRAAIEKAKAEKAKALAQKKAAAQKAAQRAAQERAAAKARKAAAAKKAKLSASRPSRARKGKGASRSRSR
jgi:endonuclease III